MSLKCPYCAAAVTLPNLQPGRYTPKCPKCNRKMLLVLAEGVAPTISALPESPTPAASSAPQKPTAREPQSAVSSLAETRVDMGEPSAAPAGDTQCVAPPPNAGAFSLGGSYAAERVSGPVAGEGAAAAGVAPSSLLGGYRILKVLGQGGMGAVFLGRQISLDRLVAVKVMKPEWASDSRFVARFTREAFAAAQLVHHNVVQIYDIGCEKDVHYFSMEFVDGCSLADLVAKDGKLDAETAARYILQAAHGLKFAHEQGMVHRDVKPDNILLNKHGVVKVADLGLVKTPTTPADESRAGAAGHRTGAGTHTPALAAVTSGSQTLANVSMGTPAYMAPEQAENAADVDQRADVYSLGCTLYALITGRPLFEGTSALDVIEKHKHEPVTPPDVLAKRTPKSVSDVIVKMVAKRPEDRYQSMDEVLKALSKVVGVETGGVFTPSESQVESLQKLVTAFGKVPAAELRTPVALGFFGSAALLSLGAVTLSAYGPLTAFLGLLVLTPIAYFIVVGARERTYLFLKAREFIFSSDLTDWAMGLVGALLVIAVLYFLGMLVVWIALAALALALSECAYRAIDEPLRKKRAPIVADAESLLKDIRTTGVEEDALRAFVAKNAGDAWEEFFEALFGYEAKIAARAKFGRDDKNLPRPKFGGWRDPIVEWIDVRQRARNEERSQKVLQQIEEKNLQAQGVSAGEARERAADAAQMMVHEAASYARETGARDGGETTADELAKARRAKMRKLMEAAERADRDESRPRKTSADRLRDLLAVFIGPRIRFIVGALLLIGGGWWLSQNDLIPGQQVAELTKTLGSDQPLGEHTENKARELANDWSTKYRASKPLSVTGVPSAVTRWFYDVNALVAGFLLLTSALFSGKKIDWLNTAGAAVAFVGPFVGVPAMMGAGPGLVCAAIGMGLGLLGSLIPSTD